MITDSDLDQRLTDLRATPRWAADQRASALEAVLSAAPVTHLAARPRRRRFGAAAAAACLVLGSGAGVAAAVVSGYIPIPLGYDAFGFAYYAREPHDPHAVPGTARLILQTPGPQGSTLRLRVADASTGGGYCSALSTTLGGVGEVVGCRPSITSFGGVDQMTGTGTSETRGFGTTEFSATVPGASTVKLSFDDGTSEPLAVADQFTIGWLTDAQTLKHPELIGYAANGAVVGRAQLFSASAQKHFACYPHC